MTHIDPFAPADSPQHPANWRPVALYPPLPPVIVDFAPALIALMGDPISAPHDDASTAEVNDILDRRWERYDELTRQFGTPEDVEILDKPQAEWPEGMRTLVELEALAADAVTVDNDPPAVATTMDDATAALAAQLKALEESGL